MPPSPPPKRKRANHLTPPPLPIAESFSAYFNDPRADILLRSVDGLLFATRRDCLVAGSLVLRDRFEDFQPVEDGAGRKRKGQEAAGVLPVFQMEEKGLDLEVYLRGIHPETLDDLYHQIKEIPILRDASVYLLPLLFLAEKYKSPAIFTLAFTIIEPFRSKDAPNVLAYAVVFNKSKLVKSAVLAWISDLEEEDPEPVRDPAYARYHVRKRELFVGSQIWSFSDILPALYARLPRGFSFHFAAAEKEMLCAVEFDAEEVVRDFMDAFEDGFPLELITKILSPVLTSGSTSSLLHSYSFLTLVIKRVAFASRLPLLKPFVAPRLSLARHAQLRPSSPSIPLTCHRHLSSSKVASGIITRSCSTTSSDCSHVGSAERLFAFASCVDLLRIF